MKALLGTTSLFSSMEKLQLEHVLEYGFFSIDGNSHPQKVQNFNFSVSLSFTISHSIEDPSHEQVFSNV